MVQYLVLLIFLPSDGSNNLILLDQVKKSIKYVFDDYHIDDDDWCDPVFWSILDDSHDYDGDNDDDDDVWL